MTKSRKVGKRMILRALDVHLNVPHEVIDGEVFLVFRKEHEKTTFEWHAPKANKVAQERGISIVDAASAFFDPFAVREQDVTHANRGTYIGVMQGTRTLFCVHAEFADPHRLRLITAREATGEEREAYAAHITESFTGRPAKGRDSSGRRAAKNVLSFAETFDRLRRGNTFRPLLPPSKKKQSNAMSVTLEYGWARTRALLALTPGARVQALRKLEGLSQQELAERSSLQQASLSRIERGVEPMTAKRAEALGKSLNIHPSELLYGPRPQR